MVLSLIAGFYLVDRGLRHRLFDCLSLAPALASFSSACVARSARFFVVCVCRSLDDQPQCDLISLVVVHVLCRILLQGC